MRIFPLLQDDLVCFYYEITREILRGSVRNAFLHNFNRKYHLLEQLQISYLYYHCVIRTLHATWLTVCGATNRIT